MKEILMNKKKCILLIIIVGVLSIVMQNSHVNAASKMLRKADKHTFAFVTTSGEACSTTVSTFLYESVKKQSSKKAIYNNRSGCIWHEDVATWSKIKVGISADPYHINGSKVVKKFKWKNQDALHTPSQKVSYSRMNKTSCTYSPKTKVQLRIGYSVNATDAILSKSRVVKLNLKY